MKLTQLVTKTRKEAPADETAKNAQLLIRAGYVHKEMAGVYTYLPLGLMVLENINSIIREEMNALGAQEMRLTSLQDADIWKATNRWDDEEVDVWFKTELKNGGELGLAPTHEEPITRALKNYISSYKDLPKLAYQIQTKLRNETRAKSGVMRGREFVMKDLYSFARNEEEHDQLYKKIQDAYLKIFNRLGIGDKTFLTFASGGMFSQFSHEFQTLCEAGEDIIYLDRSKRIAVNEEVNTDDVLNDLGLDRTQLEQVKAAEVGNIFTLRYKFSEPLDMTFTDEDGSENKVFMGSYGIGPTRLVGVITELLGDDNGLVWPKAIAPYNVHMVTLGVDKEVIEESQKMYDDLVSSGVTVLWDDRDLSAGEKFADADLLGMPKRVIISKKTLASGDYEIKDRISGEVVMMKRQDVIKYLAEN